LQSRYFEVGKDVTLVIDRLPLAVGRYGIDLIARVPGISELDHWTTEVSFEIVDCDPFGVGASYVAKNGTSPVVLAHTWS
jgi:hypothetical protein